MHPTQRSCILPFIYGFPDISLRAASARAVASCACRCRSASRACCSASSCRRRSASRSLACRSTSAARFRFASACACRRASACCRCSATASCPCAISVSACSRVKYPLASSPLSACHARMACRVRGCSPPNNPSVGPGSWPAAAQPLLHQYPFFWSQFQRGFDGCRVRRGWGGRLGVRRLGHGGGRNHWLFYSGLRARSLLSDRAFGLLLSWGCGRRSGRLLGRHHRCPLPEPIRANSNRCDERYDSRHGCPTRKRRGGTLWLRDRWLRGTIRLPVVQGRQSCAPLANTLRTGVFFYGDRPINRPQ